MTQTLASLLAQRAAGEPHGVPLIVTSGPDEGLVPVTYAQIDSAARQVAAYLAAHVPRGARALIAAPPGLDFAGAFFGCLHAGVIAVPVPPPLPGPLAGRFHAIAGSCAPELTLTTGELAPLAEDAQAAAGRIVTGAQIRRHPAAGAVVPPPGPDDIAWLQYTSGTTGAPRGVMVTHANALANMAMTRAAVSLRREDIALTWLPPFHDMGLVTGLLLPVAEGRTVVVSTPLDFIRWPERWLQQMSRWRACSASLPGFAYGLLTRRTTPAQRAQLDLSHWRLALCGADTADPAVLDAFTDAFAGAGFDPGAIYLAYGLAEAVVMAAAAAPGQGRTVIEADPEALSRGRLVPRRGGIPVLGSGWPLPGMSLGIAGPGDRKPCPPGVIGEIVIAGLNVTRGYWGQPDPGVLVAGRRFLPTGDLGAFHGGELFVLGRTADLIEVNGRQIYPALAERAAAAIAPCVRARACAAFQVGDGVVVAAETVPGADTSGTRQAIAAAAGAITGDGLAGVVLLRRGTLPFTTSGKLQRRACRDLYVSGRLGHHPAGAR